MGKFKDAIEYATKDLDAKPAPPPPPAVVNPVKCNNCGHNGVPDDGHICHMCHAALPVEEKPRLDVLGVGVGGALRQGLSSVNEFRDRMRQRP